VCVTSPAEKVAAVAVRLEGYVFRYEARRDHRAPFAYTYLRLTTALQAGLVAGEATFEDPDWVANLSEALATEYFTAMDGIDAWIEALDSSPRLIRRKQLDLPLSVPAPWRHVYLASSVPRSYVLEDVLFSMMAHMSYDLPIALRKMSAAGDVGSHIADFHRMNALLATSIEPVQAELAERYWRFLANLDHLFTQQDEVLTNYGIRAIRGLAWYNFDRLRDANADAEAARSIERSTEGFIRQVRSPGDWKLRAVLNLARLVVPSRRSWPSVPGRLPQTAPPPFSALAKRVRRR
jgi:hypothetical protein